MTNVIKKVQIPWNKGKKGVMPIPWNKGKKTPEETRRKQRDAKLKNPTKYWSGKCREDMLSEKHWNWKGGITPELKRIRQSAEYRAWRTAVFERDGYTCVLCNSSGVALNADHIKQFAYYKDLRFELSNGRTLCVPCHEATDTYKRKLKKEDI